MEQRFSLVELEAWRLQHSLFVGPFVTGHPTAEEMFKAGDWIIALAERIKAARVRATDE